MKNGRIIWTSNTVYYDIDTGEQLTKYQTKQNYLKIKTDKHGSVNKYTSKGEITYAIGFKRNPQGKLNFD